MPSLESDTITLKSPGHKVNVNVTLVSCYLGSLKRAFSPLERLCPFMNSFIYKYNYIHIHIYIFAYIYMNTCIYIYVCV